MSSNALGNNRGHYYSYGGQPVLIDSDWVIDASNGNGYGVRNVKGQGVQHVYMNSTASITGTVTLNSDVITAIAQGTSSLLPGMPVQGTSIPAGTTIKAILTTGSVQMSTNATGNQSSETITYQAPGSPNPAAGIALVKLSANYNRYLGGFSGFASPITGSSIAIDASDAALTVGQPYVITSVGNGPAGVVTIAPVADVSGSLASTYFTLYDSYGNTFVIWFSVSGVGSRPRLGSAAPLGSRGLQYIQQTITSGATAANITTALALTIPALQSGIVGTFSFTVSGGGTGTLTVTSTALAPVAGAPQDGSQIIPQSNSTPTPIWFTIASGSATSGSVWTDGFGNLYTVSATIASQTLLKTTGTQSPGAAAGTLTFVSGTGATTALTYSAAVAGLATGFTFAQTVSDTNLADWQAVGVPTGVTPAVGVSFVAKATGAGGSTGLVHAVGVSGITCAEVIGDPNLSIAPQPQGGSPNVGGWILMQFLGATNSSTTTLIPKAPASGSVAGCSFNVDVKLTPSNIIAHV